MQKIYVLFFLLLTGMAQAQKGAVRGKVTDASDGSPLPGVSILEKGTTNGTTTDAQGAFTLQVSPGATLAFSFIGYQSQELAVGSQSVLDVSLKPESTTLTDVVVIGYGTIEKRDVTGSIASVNNKEFKDQPTT
ncbi:MAG: carboxypeptidase-like regulatory domain-containing protein, partial [Bacteroidota bacterium]